VARRSLSLVAGRPGAAITCLFAYAFGKAQAAAADWRRWEARGVGCCNGAADPDGPPYRPRALVLQPTRTVSELQEVNHCRPGLVDLRALSPTALVLDENASRRPRRPS